MLALKIIGIIIVLFLLVSLIPIGVDVSFLDDRFKLSAKIMSLLIQIFPKTKESIKKKPKEKPTKEKKEKVKKEKKNKSKKKLSFYFSFDEIIGLLNKVCKTFGRFFGKFNVDRFIFHYLAAGNNPYYTAKEFAYVNAIISSLAPICDKRFKCKNTDVWTDIDFNEDLTNIDFAICITLPIGAIFGLINGILFGAVGIFIKNFFRLTYEKYFDKEQYIADTTKKNFVLDLIKKLKLAKAEKAAQEAAYAKEHIKFYE